MLHVRFIAINDDFDNIRQSDVDSLAVPICLCQKFFMKDREKRTQSIRRIMLRQQNL